MFLDIMDLTEISGEKQSEVIGDIFLEGIYQKHKRIILGLAEKCGGHVVVVEKG